MHTQKAQRHSFPIYAQNDSAGIVTAIKNDGMAIIPEVLTQGKVSELCDMIDHTAQTPRKNDELGKGEGMDHLKCVFNRDPYWLQYLDYSGIIEAVETLHGDQCHIIGMTAWRSPPGTGRKYIHSDQIFIPMDEELLTSGRVELPVFISTLHFYLNDIDNDLCPTWAIKGSHKSGRKPRSNYDYDNPNAAFEYESSWNGVEEQPVLVNAGDCMLFRSELWHGGSANNSSQTRYLLQVHYAQRGIAQRFNPYLEFQFNPEVIAAASERQLRLIGKHPIAAYG